ncbi:MAG: hypothetical protein EHJ94_07045, partial [Deltaproteobacteria bacterium]
MTDGKDMDREILTGFLDESMESLGQAENFLIQLEKEPGNIDIINRIFRPVHSLKGSAAFFGLMQVKSLSHKMEDLLDALRKKKMVVSSRVLDVLLPGIDLLKQMLIRVRDGGAECDDPDTFGHILASVTNFMDDSGDLFQQMTKGLERIAEHLEFIREQLPDAFSDLMDEPIQTLFSLMPQKIRKTDQPEQQGISIPAVEKLIRMIEKPFDGEASDEICREIETLLSEAVEVVPEPLKKTMEQIQEIFNTFVHSPIGLDNLARESMLDQARTLRIYTDIDVDPDSRTESSKGGNETTEEMIQIQKTEAFDAPGKEKASGTSKTMRIPEDSLDAFLENVGELMGIEEMFRHLYRQLLQKGVTSRFSTDLKQMIDQFGQFSSRLRKGIMDVRKVEAQSLLGKANRIVRDIA